MTFRARLDSSSDIKTDTDTQRPFNRHTGRPREQEMSREQAT